MNNNTHTLKKGVIALSVLGCMISIKLLYAAWMTYDKVSDEALFDPWESRLAIRMILAFVVLLIGLVINKRLSILISLIASLFVVGEFAGWYYFSYRAFHNPYVGESFLSQKLGLVQASWGHVLLMLIIIASIPMLMKIAIQRKILAGKLTDDFSRPETGKN